MTHTNEARRHAQKHCFALANQLLPRLKARGITENDLWDAIKADFGVASRSDIGEFGYVLLSARLQAAQRHRKLFDTFCREIQRSKHERGTQHLHANR